MKLTKYTSIKSVESGRLSDLLLSCLIVVSLFAFDAMKIYSQEVRLTAKTSGNHFYYDYGQDNWGITKDNEDLLIGIYPFVGKVLGDNNNLKENQHLVDISSQTKVGFYASSNKSVTLLPGFCAGGQVHKEQKIVDNTMPGYETGLTGFTNDGYFEAAIDDKRNHTEDILNCDPKNLLTDIKKDEIKIDNTTQKFQKNEDETKYLYSTAYNNDWKCLPNGKELNEHKKEKVKFKDVTLNNSSNYFDGAFYRVEINGNDIKIYNKESNYIDKNPSKETTLFSIEKDNDIPIGINITKENNSNKTLICLKYITTLIIENLYITVENGLKIETLLQITEATNLIIRNCFFQGEIKNFINLDMCNNIFIDRVEICGADNKTCGYGIYSKKQKYGEKIIQNCYLHDCEKAYVLGKDDQADGILLNHNNGNTLIFNNYFENWLPNKGGALEVSRPNNRNNNGKVLEDMKVDEKKLKNFVSRIERNIFENARFVKTSGTYFSEALKDETIKNDFEDCKNSNNCIAFFFTNNIYYNTFLYDYHNNFNSFHINETYINTLKYCTPPDDNDETLLFKIGDTQSDFTPENNIFFNNIIYFSPITNYYIYYMVKNFTDMLDNLVTDNNLYLTPDNTSSKYNICKYDGSQVNFIVPITNNSNIPWGDKDNSSYIKTEIEQQKLYINSVLKDGMFYKLNFKPDENIKPDNYACRNTLGQFSTNSNLTPGLFNDWDYYKNPRENNFFPGAVEVNGGKKKKLMDNPDEEKNMENKNLVVKVYPNPAKGALFVEYNIDEAGSFGLFNLTGQKLADYILPAGYNKIEIKINIFAAGIYFYYFKTKTEKVKEKLIIVKE
ncbi:MAG: T9SS type A sorting domain-containing protein [Bacteroidales bacterium]|nr:T9SS type A sorting domain-containing protein [Bacteroidales bacterium]